tara:strand:- start:193 stop:5877 length:5685 start_codon:yes stop_codon:yes gene_type:complete
MASVNAFKVRAIIEAGYDKTSLNRANRDIAASYNQLTGKLKGIQRASSVTQQTAAMIGASYVAAFGASIAAAAAFEEQFVAVKKTLNVAGDAKQVEKAFDNISRRLRDMVKLAPITTQAINEIAAIGGQLGVAASEIVKFTDTIQKLTIATNLSADQAALSMARLQEITGTTGNELDNLASSLVALGNNFAATESEVVTAALQIATATAQIGGEMNQTAVDALAFSTTLKAIGQPSQAGATAIVRLMTELSEAIALGGKNLQLFADVAGMSVDSFKTLFDIDSTKAVALFIDGLNNVERLGKTNIGVLQELGLGQVRTQKAILATAKASDTLFEAIDVANKAFIENNALNEEAERRYQTLVSEITKGKNVIKGEILDFGLDRLDTGTNIVRQFTNAIFALVQGITSALNASVRMFSVFTVGIAAFRAYRVVVGAAREELGLYSINAELARAATERFNASIGAASAAGIVTPHLRPPFGKDSPLISKEYQQELFEGGFYNRGLKGKMSLNPFRVGRQRELRRSIVHNPTLMQMIYGGNVPESMQHLTQGTGVAMTRYGSSEMAGVSQIQSGMLASSPLLKKLRKRSVFNQLQDPTTFMGAWKAQRSVAKDQRLINRMMQTGGGLDDLRTGAILSPLGGMFGNVKVDDTLRKDVEHLKRLRRLNQQRMSELKGIMKDLRPFGRGGRTRGMSVLREALAGTTDVGLDFQRAMGQEGRGGIRGLIDRRRLEKAMPMVAQNSKEFQKNLAKSVKALNAGDIAGGKLALAMQDVDAHSGRLVTTLKGLAMGFAKLAMIAIPLTLAFKWIEKLGEESRGVMQFTDSMRQMNDATMELTQTTKKLADARNLLSQNMGDAQIVDMLTKEIQDIEKAIENQRVSIAENVGKSFIENIMNASFGGLSGRTPGGYFERFVKDYGNFLQDETGVMNSYGKAIGDVIVALTDPEHIERTAGRLPTGNDIIEGLLFAEGGFGEEVIVPSGFFKGASAEIIEQLIKDSEAISGEEFIKFLGIDSSKFDKTGTGEIWEDIAGGVMRFVGGKMSPEEFMRSGELKWIAGSIKELTEGMDLNPREMAEITAGIASFIMSVSAMTGTTADNIKGFERLDENSPAATAIKRFLKGRLEDFEAAGQVTEQQINVAGDDYQALIKLFTNTQNKFLEENKKSIDALMEEFGVSEQAALRLAIRVEDAFKRARQSMLDFTKPLPENQFDDTSLLDLIVNAQSKAMAQEKFEEVIRQLRTSSPFLADQLSQMGIMGGGLELAERFLANPNLALAQETSLRAVAGPDYLQEIFGTSDPEMSEMAALGQNIVDGIAEGFADKEGALADALIDTMKYVVDETKKYIESQSPSQLASREIGMPLIEGIALPAFFMKGKVADAYVGVVKNAVTAASEAATGLDMQGVINSLIAAGGTDYEVSYALQKLGAGGNQEEFLASYNKMIKSNIPDATSRIREAFDLTQNVVQAERAQVKNARNLAQAKHDYVTLLNSEGKIQRQLAETTRQRVKMEVDGMAGNITLSERAGLLRQKIDIDERQRRLRGDFSASEQLAINRQEEKVREYQRMFNLGAIGALDLEAEQDRLRDMKGGFKTEAEKELFFIEAALAEEQYKEAERVALLEDSQLQELRDAEAGLIFQLENFATDKEIAYGRIEEAAEGVALGIILLEQAQQKYKEKAPEYINELEILDTSFDGVSDSMNRVLDATNAFGEVDSGALVTKLTPVVEKLAELNTAMAIAKAYFGQGKVVDPSMHGSFEGSEFQKFLDSGGKYTGPAARNKFDWGHYFDSLEDFMEQYNKGFPGGGQMGLRTKGYAYGGRPDGAMRRALVGEYGPEEVRFVPGSGFLVKPLTAGGRGTNTIVNELNVNVTGVPADPTSARKAAVEIRKALSRLDKEGTAGGGLTRR